MRSLRATFSWRRGWAMAVTALCLAGGIALSPSACSVSNSGTGPTMDGGTSASADVNADGEGGGQHPLEGGATEAGPCLGVQCNGRCLDASDCTGCSSATLLCGPNRTCTTNCEGCAD